MKNLIVILALIFTNIGHFAEASIAHLEASVEYHQIIALCRAYTSSSELSQLLNVSENLMKKTYAGFQSTFNSNEFGASDSLQKLFSSQGYYDAMTECFGPYEQHRWTWDGFAAIFLMSESFGKAIGYIGIFYGLPKLFYSSLTTIGKLSTVKNYLKAYPKVVSAFKIAMVSYFTISTGVDAYETYDSMQDFTDPQHARESIRKQMIGERDDDSKQLIARIDARIEDLKKQPEDSTTGAKITRLHQVRENILRAHEEKTKKLYKIISSS
jgi:hypothetical protein